MQMLFFFYSLGPNRDFYFKRFLNVLFSMSSQYNALKSCNRNLVLWAKTNWGFLLSDLSQYCSVAYIQTSQVLVVESGQEVGERKGERRVNPLIIPADVWAIGDNSTLTDCSSPLFQEQCQCLQEQETWQSQTSLFTSALRVLNFVSPTSERGRMGAVSQDRGALGALEIRLS